MVPVESKNYPQEKRNKLFVRVEAMGPMTGMMVNAKTGDVTVHAARQAVVRLGGYLWDALGYLDVIEARQRAMADDLAEVRQTVSQLASVVADIKGLVDKLGVLIPPWPDRERVENGGYDDDMGVWYIPSASELGLVVTYREVESQSEPPGAVLAIEPPADTFVSRGTRVTVTINRE